jgi:hypothetical protein
MRPWLVDVLAGEPIEPIEPIDELSQTLEVAAAVEKGHHVADTRGRNPETVRRAPRIVE